MLSSEIYYVLIHYDILTISILSNDFHFVHFVEKFPLHM